MHMLMFANKYAHTFTHWNVCVWVLSAAATTVSDISFPACVLLVQFFFKWRQSSKAFAGSSLSVRLAVHEMHDAMSWRNVVGRQTFNEEEPIQWVEPEKKGRSQEFGREFLPHYEIVLPGPLLSATCTFCYLTDYHERVKGGQVVWKK